MTKIESDKVIIENSAENLFKCLINFNNFEHLMPEQVNDWESTEDSCSFNLSGMATVNMTIAEKTPNSQIKITSTGKPIDFDLIIELNEQGSNCEAQIILEANLNPMLKMMAEKPLRNFINLLASKLKELK